MTPVVKMFRRFHQHAISLANKIKPITNFTAAPANLINNNSTKQQLLQQISHANFTQFDAEFIQILQQLKSDAGADQNRLYAKISIKNTMFTVTKSDIIHTHLLKDVLPGMELTMDFVKEVGSPSITLRASRPGSHRKKDILRVFNPDLVKVSAIVLEHCKAEKVIARKGYKADHRHFRKKTIRPMMTKLRITDIKINV